MCYDDNYDHKDNDDDDDHDDEGGDDYDNADEIDDDDDDRDDDDDDGQGGRVGSGSVELGWRDLRPGTVGKWEDTGSRCVIVTFSMSSDTFSSLNCHMSHFPFFTFSLSYVTFQLSPIIRKQSASGKIPD